MMSDSVPLPRPSSAPEPVTVREDTIKPAQIMRSAVWPAAIVSGLELNTFISGPANTRHSTVPPAMMVPVMARVRL